jgi:hypothetical protein
VLGWKGLPRTSTLDYWAHSLVTVKIKCCEYGFRSTCFTSEIVSFGLGLVENFSLHEVDDAAAEVVLVLVGVAEDHLELRVDGVALYVVCTPTGS